MNKIVKKEINIDGKLVVIETGKIARQADSAVLVRAGGTVVLCVVTFAKNPSLDCNFLPLTVNYVEKYYAAGKIPGGYIKREGKSSESSILVSRLIDRSIRPIISANFYNEININCTVLSYDPKNTPDTLALIGSSAAIAISGVPIDHLFAAVKIGIIGENFVINPSETELKNSKLDLMVAGTKSSFLMVESESKELSEEKMLDAMEYGHDYIKLIVNEIEEFKKTCLKKSTQSYQTIDAELSLIEQSVKSILKSKLIETFKPSKKLDRALLTNEIDKSVADSMLASQQVDPKKLATAIKNISKKITREYIIETKNRADGRSAEQVREIEAELEILPQVHGSSLFTRGETQALAVVTLGSGSKDKQIIDGLSSKAVEESFMLHYNFPPYSVGEVGQTRAPGRREIGHGRLAWKAINPVLPSAESFNYAIRIVSEIMESDGSSSMATVCAASLALMDAGVPIKLPVSGIAMGLIKEGEKYVILSDIMGEEDHIGDMDFKVAGTKQGITALQMDIKISGIDIKILKDALSQANKGRMHILNKMNKVIELPKAQFNCNVPRVESINVPQRKIKDIIGPRGSVIKEICTSSGATIDVDDSGLVKVSSNNSDAMKKAIEMIQEITFEPELGDIFEGPVVKVIDAGAFVSISPSKDGFIHISELANYRVDFVEDVINEGDVVKAKVIGFDKRGRPKLSYRCVDQSTGEDISHKSFEHSQVENGN